MMQSNIEGYFKAPSTLLSAQNDIIAVPRETTTRTNTSRTNLMNILSGQQQRQKLPEPLGQKILRKEEPSSLHVTLKISPYKLKSLQKTRVNPRDIFHKTTVVRRKMMVSFKVDPLKLRNLNNRVELVNSSSDIETENDVEIEIGTSTMTDDDDDDELQNIGSKSVNIKDILGNPKPKRRMTEDEIEIIAETKNLQPVPAFKSKVSASDVLQSFKERQLEKVERQNIREGDVDQQNSNHSFFQDVAERAQVSKMMKDRGINRPIPEPILSKYDFHVYDKSIEEHRKLDLRLKKSTLPAPDLNEDEDPRFGPLLLQQEIQNSTYHFAYSPVSDHQLNAEIQLRIGICKGNSRLNELLSLVDTEEFYQNKLQNNLLLCNLIKPRNPHGLLIPSKKSKQLTCWFKENFENLPKKKPNRGHLFKKSQEDSFSELDSFIMNDLLELEEDGVERDLELPLLIITGDHGVGKTAAIDAILNDLNAYVYDLESSTIDKKDVKEMALHQKYDNHIKQDSCIMFDEIPEDDETFFGILRSVLMITRKPIVLTINNDERKRLPHWLNQVKTFNFKKINEPLMITYLSIISLIMRFDIDASILRKIVKSCKHDLRRCINEVQLLICGINKMEVGVMSVTFPESVKKDLRPPPENLSEMYQQYYKKSLIWDDDEVDEEDSITLQEKTKLELYQSSIDYYNSKNSYKFSKRQVIMPKHFEFTSRIYNLNSTLNWNLFRLEFHEYLKKMAQLDSLRETHNRKFTNDPLDFLNINHEYIYKSI